MTPVHLQQPPPHHYDIPKKVASSSLLFSPPCLTLLFFLLCQIAAANTAAKTYPFYGYEYIAQLSARFTTHLFACPPAIHTFAGKAVSGRYLRALILLQRSKARLPTACGSSGHCLFISAFMIASKVICDNTYSNKSWSIVTQGMFTLREINQSDGVRDVQLSRLGTHGRQPILGNFEAMVQRDFPPGSKGPYPTYSLHMVSKCAAKAAASTSATPIPEPNSTTSPIPVFGQQHQPTPTKVYLAPPPPIIPNPCTRSQLSPQ
ncbi:hypothetical protein B0H19DRAFT_174411 [Mycena capillaripes]|nr:hypothetical protein B0H19DRAFT_174411 [Mycena capillaripes]